MENQQYVLKVKIKNNELNIDEQYFIGNRKSLKENLSNAKRFNEIDVNKFTYDFYDIAQKFVNKNKIYTTVLLEVFDIKISICKLVKK